MFFGMRICRSHFLMISGSESGCLGFQNQVVWEVLQKPAFHICRDYVDVGVIFTWFSMALGAILMTFGGLGPGLKHYDFRWFSGGGPELRNHGHSRLFGILSGPIVILQTVSSSNSTCKIHHETTGMKGYEKEGCKLRKYGKSRL